MMGRDFLLHLYLESPVFFQIQPGNLEQPVGTDKCSIARACTLGPSSCVFMLFIQLFIDVFKRWKPSLSPPTLHPRKPSKELAVYSGQGQEKSSASYLPFWISPLWLPFSWSFGGSFEWEHQNCFALLTQESWEAQTASAKYFRSGASGHGVLILKHICGQVILLLHKELCVLWGMSVQALGPLVIPLLSILKWILPVSIASQNL